MADADDLFLNGARVEATPLGALIADNYGHFTVLQVEDARARGLGLHLARLDEGSRVLFGSALEPARVRAYLRAALAGVRGAQVLRVHVFARAFDRQRPGAPVVPDVLVMRTRAVPRAATPLAVKTFHHRRVLPEIKHVGTFPLFHFRRLAQAEGFDDALFVDAAGEISEGSVWNVVFFDGARFVWPAAPQLPGVAKRLLQTGLHRLGQPSEERALALGDLERFRAAFFSNALQPVRPLARIDAVEFAGDAAAAATLAAAYETNPWEDI